MPNSVSNKKKLFARVAIPAHIYVSVPIEEGETEEQMLKRAAETVESAEADAEYLEISQGFSDEADPNVYPVRDTKGNVSTANAFVEDFDEADESSDSEPSLVGS